MSDDTIANMTPNEVAIMVGRMIDERMSNEVEDQVEPTKPLPEDPVGDAAVTRRELTDGLDKISTMIEEATKKPGMSAGHRSSEFKITLLTMVAGAVAYYLGHPEIAALLIGGKAGVYTLGRSIAKVTK